MDWSPGALTARLAQVQVAADAGVARAVSGVAAAVEREAKLAVGRAGSHLVGTPTPASRGGAPAIITGALRRSIVHTTAIPTGLTSWEARAGMAAGVYPPPAKPGRQAGKTPTSRYGLYLETVWDYPFMGPAFNVVAHTTQFVSFFPRW